MPATNESDAIHAKLESFRKFNNPEIDAVIPDFLNLMTLQAEFANNPNLQSDDTIDAEKLAGQMRFITALEVLIDKLELIKLPPTELVETTKGLQLLWLMLMYTKTVGNLQSLFSSIDTIGADSVDLKEFSQFLVKCAKLHRVHDEVSQLISAEDLGKLHLMQKMLTSVAKTNDSFAKLTDKMATIDPEKSSIAFAEVTVLMHDLEAARIAFYEKLPTVANEADLITLSNEFIKNCTDAVIASQDVLENELSWGDFLKDFLESLTKFLVTVVTLGFGSTNFSFYSNPNKLARKALDDMEVDLAFAAMPQSM